MSEILNINRAIFFILGIIIVIPLLATCIDIFQKEIPLSGNSFFWGYILYIFKIGYLILFQLAYIPIAFVAGPVSILLIVMTIAHFFIFAFGNPVDPTALPLTCSIFSISSESCIPALVFIHPCQIGLMILLYNIKEIYFDLGANYYKNIMEFFLKKLGIQDSDSEHSIEPEL